MAVELKDYSWKIFDKLYASTHNSKWENFTFDIEMNVALELEDKIIIIWSAFT